MEHRKVYKISWMLYGICNRQTDENIYRLCFDLGYGYSNFYNHNSSCAVTVIILYCDCCTAFYNFEWWIDLSDASYGNERPDSGKISNTSEDYLGTKALFPVKSLLIWGGIQLLALILNFAGALLKEKKRSGRHQEMYIAPEEMVGDRRSGMQRTVKTQATEYVPQRRNENRIKKDWGMDQQRSRMQGRSTFSGAIRGLQRMYEKKVYPMSMGEAVWICSDGVHIFMTKADQSIEHELLAEVFYVAEYEEYWLTPEKKRMVFLESGQPLGEKREYYIPRGTIIQVSYSNNMEPMRFELA